MEDDNIFIFLLCSGLKSFDKCYLAGWQDGGRLYFSVGQAFCKSKCICSSCEFLFCPHPLLYQGLSAVRIMHVPFCPCPRSFSSSLLSNTVLLLPPPPFPLSHTGMLRPLLPHKTIRKTGTEQRSGCHHAALPTVSVNQMQCVTWIWKSEDQTHCKAFLPLSDMENTYCNHTNPVCPLSFGWTLEFDHITRGLLHSPWLFHEICTLLPCPLLLLVASPNSLSFSADAFADPTFP